MKSSDSSNSLAALNPDDPACLICLEIENELAEPLVESKNLRNCGCKFFVHPFCWNKWMESKGPYDCPICHKKSMQSPGPPTPLPIFPDMPIYGSTYYYMFGSIILIGSIIILYMLISSKK
jgi:E3 ubiquitin-protein ligase DOA10